MKISVFGKSGPRLVTTGLVCASATVGPAAIQPAAASTTKNPRILLDISTLPALWFYFVIAYHGVRLCRAIWVARTRSTWNEPLHRRDKGLFSSLGYADDRPPGSAVVLNSRSNRSYQRPTEPLPCRCKVWPLLRLPLIRQS